MSDSESDIEGSEKKNIHTGINDKPVRSSKDIKAKQLKDLWMTDKAAEKIRQILSYHNKSEKMVEGQGHQSSVYATIPHQDSAMMRKNWRNYLDGYGMQMSAPDYVPDPKREAAAAAFKGDGDIRNTDIYKIYQEIVQAEKENPLPAPKLLLENASLILAESARDVKNAGLDYYADDAYLAHQPDDDNGELNYTLYPDTHAPYTDNDYQLIGYRDGDRLYSEIFNSAATLDEDAKPVIPDISNLFNAGGLNVSGRHNIQPVYREDEFNPEQIALKSKDGTDGSKPVQTMLDYEGCNDIHSPYADGFFNVARWPEAAPDSVEREHIRQELQDTYGVNIVIDKPKLQ